MQLKRKKNYEAEIEKLYGMITNLEAQTMALRSSTINQQYVAVAKEATAALKVQQEQVSVEAVDDLRDDFEEVMSMHTEMNQVLGQEWNTTSSMDDTELENELAELEAAEVDQSINAIPQAPVAARQSAAAIEITSEAFPSAPLAPTTSPITMPQAPTAAPTKVVATSMDDELAALEAGL
jgi:Snf7